MLDSTHPITQHVVRASGLMDRVMSRGQEMSVSPSAVRAALLAECLPLFAEMRELARARFGKRAAFILVAVDEHEAALRALGALGDGRITEDRRDGEGACPACGAPITKFRPLPDCKGFEEHWIILCRECDKPFMEDPAAEQSVASGGGRRLQCIHGLRRTPAAAELGVSYHQVHSCRRSISRGSSSIFTMHPRRRWFRSTCQRFSSS